MTGRSCTCEIRTKLVGDGCEICNPAKALEYAKETIAELRLQLTASEKQREWQPIETAPKDKGSEVLLLKRMAVKGDHSKTICRCVASFNAAHGWFTVPGNWWIHPDQIIGWQPLPEVRS